MAQSKTPWVVAGGKIGEMAHCERCGDGLEIGGPQRLEIALAAMNAFIKIHKNCKVGVYKEPLTNTPQKWLRGRDTGISSCTIYAVMMNQSMDDYNIPHDPDDFGRCYRLLQLFPEWTKRLDEVASRFPIWRPFVREWDKLTEMFATGFDATGSDGGVMYRFMQQLEKESEASA